MNEATEIISALQQLPVAMGVGFLKAWATLAGIAVAGYFFSDWI